MARENHSLPAPVSASSNTLTLVHATLLRRDTALAICASPESSWSSVACGSTSNDGCGLAWGGDLPPLAGTLVAMLGDAAASSDREKTGRVASAVGTAYMRTPLGNTHCKGAVAASAASSYNSLKPRRNSDTEVWPLKLPRDSSSCMQALRLAASTLPSGANASKPSISVPINSARA